MAGLCVLLETKGKNQQPGKPAQIISKALLHGSKLHVSLQPSAPPVRTAPSSFLQRCSLCHKELAEGRDIYMYRGDRAFCSAECRSRQIFMDEDAGDGGSYTKGATAARGSRRAGGGGFGF